MGRDFPESKHSLHTSCHLEHLETETQTTICDQPNHMGARP